MTYAEHLNPWAVVCLLPNMQRVVVARSHYCSDADGYTQSLQRLMPDATFVVVFDPIN